MTADENSASLSRFDIEFGDCDESLHPHCEGVVCDTVLLVSGFETVEHAEEYARDLLYDRYTVADVLSGPGEGLTASTMMTGERDPATVIIRDYNVADNACPSGDRSYTFVAGGHDEFSLEDLDPDPAPEELATVMPGLQPEDDHVKLRLQRESDARQVDVATSSVTRAVGR